MTKKIKHWKGRSKTTASVIKTVNKDSFASAICPTNVDEQKEKFLTFGKTPQFVHRGTEDELEEIYQKPRSEIRFDLLGEALHILKIVKTKYGDAENFYFEMYGEKLCKEEATDILVDYLKNNHLDGAMNIIWCKDLPCSGRMMWQGPHVKFKRPEDRKYSMWIKDSKDNNFLREQGMTCLADHEIGTHFFRSYNDGLQTWFSDRQMFGLRGLACLESLRTEEGLAAINTILNAKQSLFPFIFSDIACKAAEMTFKQLFEHLSLYVKNPEWRWRHCVRVKRGLLNPNDMGGYGKDQCYFEGAVEILRNIDNIDFKILMSGKICFDEVCRVKKLARLNCIKMPVFMRDQDKYKKSLRQVAQINGLHLKHTQYKAPAAYIRRLRRGRRIGVSASQNKVRMKVAEGECVGRRGVCEQGGDSTDEEEAEINDSDRRFFRTLENPGFSGNISSTGKDENMLHESKSSQFGGDAYTDRSAIYSYNSVINDCKRKSVPYQSTSAMQTNYSVSCEDEVTKQPYRCLSRASVISRLGMRSNSLNSRANKNNNSDYIEYYGDMNCRPESCCSRASYSAILSQDDAINDASDTEDCLSQKLYTKPPLSPMKSLRKYHTPISTALVPNTSADCSLVKGQISCTSTEGQKSGTKGESHKPPFELTQQSTDFQSTMSHLPRQFSVHSLYDPACKRSLYPDGLSSSADVQRGRPMPDTGLLESREPTFFTKSQPESTFHVKLLSLRSNSSANMLSE